MNAQNYITNPKVTKVSPQMNMVAPFLKTIITGYESNSGLEKSIPGPSINPYTSQPPVQFTNHETIIGITTYDLQSNSAVQNRIMNNGDGTISAVWTYSESFDIAAADRGTGYNFYDGTNWGPIPTARIEAEKTGWPNIGATAGGSEVFICHNIQQGQLTSGIRTTIGSGPWTLANITPGNDMVWNRMAIGGANGQTIHHISLFDPFGGPYPGTGVQSQMLYWRSQDGGQTYDINEAVIPGLDQTNYTAFSGDSYHIAAKGDTVAVVYFGALDPTILAKSTDNGDTWTTTVIYNAFPAGVTYDAGSNNTTGAVIGISDINGDGIPDTTKAGSDGAGWVLLDNDGMVHVFYGAMDYIDETPGDDAWSYFPGTNGMMYWNENFGDRDAVVIGGSIDTDGSGVLDIVGIAQYFQSLSAFPSAGIAADNCIYVSYSAVMENMDQGSQNYRHVYIVKSCDNGCSWSDPIDVTIGTGFEENVYCSMAHDVDANINIVWQRDFEPGIAVNGDNDAYVTNDIVHAKIPVTDINTSPVVCIGWIEGDTMFCAGDSVLLNATCGTAWLWSDGATTQSTWYTGAFGTVTVDITTACGTLNQSINVVAPSTAPQISVSSTTTEMCDGDQATITVTSNAGGIISWSTGASTTSITVDSTGTYTVTVTNCGGVSIDSVVISPPNNPPVFTLSATSSIICNGDSSWITASSVSQGTIVWSTGDTVWTIGVDSVGTYTATVTNCGGTTVETITLSLPAAPVAVITGNDPYCNGDSIMLMAGSEPSATYVWSTGDSTQSIMVSDENTYTVTVTNCGGSDATTVTTAFQPAPAITVTTGTLAFCENIGTADVTLSAFAFGASPFIYVWSNGDTTQFLTLEMVSESGAYTVTAYDACGSSATSPADTVTISDSPSADTVSVTDASSFGAADGEIMGVVTGGTPPYMYLWNDPIGQTTIGATGLLSGTYTMLVTDDNGCTSSVTAFVDQPVTVGEINIGQFSIQPNPNNGNFTVNLTGLYNETYTFEIRNILGQMIYAETFNGAAVNSVDLNLTKANKGVYFLTISNSKGKRTEKLVIR